MEAVRHSGIMNEDVPKGLFLEHFFVRISKVIWVCGYTQSRKLKVEWRR